MARQTDAQKETVERVMHEFKHGELEQRNGKRVRNPRQAIAIALSEAGASNRQSPEENRRRLKDTKRKERSGRTARDAAEGKGPTRAELYAEARKRDLPGRSRMTKDELARALKA
ncbi:DUF6496 domain-containing protein [Chthonobacter rhizosphaerae]|uniref:DUF6496 domain-containing protein n=1 Tax=Chthonobacter rhizosphaerae TaxID=2735553 RepID=UPI0015EF8223|nr:DUF6496 domain-containing protein [Chthonobacter rhizosphaerae]